MYTLTMKKVLTVRETRANFHKVLKMAANNETIVIENQDTGEKFKIISFQEKPKRSKTAFLKALSKIGFQSGDPTEIRESAKNRLAL